MDSLIIFGDAVKALGEGRVGGYLIRYSGPEQKDLTGEYFTPETYLGAHGGDGSDCLFHHGMPVKSGLEVLADRLFRPLKTRKDDIGVWAETVLDMADEYEAKVYELTQSGALGWSSGAAAHMVRKAADGQILRWPIAEGSLTPTPCEPQNRALTLKAWLEQEEAEDLPAGAPEATGLEQVKSYSLIEHSKAVVSANVEYAERLEERFEARVKAGRVLSQANLDEIDAVLETMHGAHTRLKAVREKARPMETDQQSAESVASGVAGTHLFAEHQRTLARLNGVPC